MLAGLFLLAVVPTFHGLYGYAQAVSSILNVLDTIRVEDPATLRQESVLGNPNGARFSIWLDHDWSFTARKSGEIVFSTHGPAVLARTLSFEYMALDCAGAEQLPEYKPHGEDVFVALAYGGFIPYGFNREARQARRARYTTGLLQKKGAHTREPVLLGSGRQGRTSQAKPAGSALPARAPDAVTCI